MSDRDNITLPRFVVQEAAEALEFAEQNHGGDDCYAQEIANLRAHLAAPRPEPRPSFADPEPSGYAYRYNDGVLRFNGGSTINGAPPIEVLPYWFAPPAAAPDDIEALRRDAERYRWLREKDGIAVDVTVFGSMEANLDAAIDAAMGDKT